MKNLRNQAKLRRVLFWVVVLAFLVSVTGLFGLVLTGDRYTKSIVGKNTALSALADMRALYQQQRLTLRAMMVDFQDAEKWQANLNLLQAYESGQSKAMLAAEEIKAVVSAQSRSVFILIAVQSVGMVLVAILAMVLGLYVRYLRNEPLIHKEADHTETKEVYDTNKQKTVDKSHDADPNTEKETEITEDITAQPNSLPLNETVEEARNTEELIANTVEISETSARMAYRTAQSLAEIVAGIHESSRIIGNIARASEKQAVRTTGSLPERDADSP